MPSFASLPQKIRCDIAYHLPWRDFNTFRTAGPANYKLLTNDSIRTRYPLTPAQLAIASTVSKLLRIHPVAPGDEHEKDPIQDILEALLRYTGVKLNIPQHDRSKQYDQLTQYIIRRNQYEVCIRLGSRGTVFEVGETLWEGNLLLSNGREVADELNAIFEDNGTWMFDADAYDYHGPMLMSDMMEYKGQFSIEDLAVTYMEHSLEEEEDGAVRTGALAFSGSPLWAVALEVLGRRLYDVYVTGLRTTFGGDYVEFVYHLSDLGRCLGILNTTWALLTDIFLVTNDIPGFTHAYAAGPSDSEPLPYNVRFIPSPTLLALHRLQDWDQEEAKEDTTDISFPSLL
ncbi:hypothetical protein BJ508DRAFT_301673 [Ascobolus immersus RN42]|uniref:F-box domain-containing protein n=1 Tax=Ascobolus immersus RN42 TaxID=1160509 RepID=A0A3N4ILV8_ASCIM|nr:hypothetical protein BJ508DRAFT_301673 [Ascobolus immersus RN42]